MQLSRQLHQHGHWTLFSVGLPGVTQLAVHGLVKVVSAVRTILLTQTGYNACNLLCRPIANCHDEKRLHRSDRIPIKYRTTFSL